MTRFTTTRPPAHVDGLSSLHTIANHPEHTLSSLQFPPSATPEDRALAIEMSATYQNAFGLVRYTSANPSDWSTILLLGLMVSKRRQAVKSAWLRATDITDEQWAGMAQYFRSTLNRFNRNFGQELRRVHSSQMFAVRYSRLDDEIRASLDDTIDGGAMSRQRGIFSVRELGVDTEHDIMNATAYLHPSSMVGQESAQRVRLFIHSRWGSWIGNPLDKKQIAFPPGDTFKLTARQEEHNAPFYQNDAKSGWSKHATVTLYLWVVFSRCPESLNNSGTHHSRVLEELFILGRDRASLPFVLWIRKS